ncbi:hypothetical protein CP962_05575 [Arcobacter ellisii]|uniref:Uncharacterized protein n=1 Tax=Arcobacter ellisii TaxID=913109 RepID=A0AA94FAH5_9BACT|nr:hypothetical protein CP962_05575 [Arcobacter ellisii]
MGGSIPSSSRHKNPYILGFVSKNSIKIIIHKNLKRVNYFLLFSYIIKKNGIYNKYHFGKNSIIFCLKITKNKFYLL